MTLDTILAAVGGGAYVVASVLAVASLLRRRGLLPGAVAFFSGAGACCLCAVLLVHAVQARFVSAFSRFDALTGYGVAVTAAFLLMARRKRVWGVAAFLLPFVTVMVLAGFAGGRGPAAAPAPAQRVWLALHVTTAFIAYALFSLAGVLSVAYLVQDHNLKRKRLGLVFERLPALETLDQLMSRQVGFAFLLLTVSIALGFTLVRLSGGGSEWLTDPKVASTVATWAVYAVLVHLRASIGRHGKGVALMTIFGFACVLFTFVGVHVVTHSMHGFMLVAVPVN